MESPKRAITFADDEALLVIDVQNDFCQGGSLAVPNGDEVVPVLNEYVSATAKHGRSTIFTRDWHPRVTRHFKEFGGQWPVHCVQETVGARFAPGLQHVPWKTAVVSKGMNPDEDAYDGFQAVTFAIRGESLHDLLQRLGIRRLKVGGLATDYCVKATVLTARKLGYDVEVIRNACRAVNIQPDDGEKAFAEMKAAGAVII